MCAKIEWNSTGKLQQRLDYFFKDFQKNYKEILIMNLCMWMCVYLEVYSEELAHLIVEVWEVS